MSEADWIKQAEADRLEDALTAAIDAICRRAGGLDCDPSPREVRAILERHGLMVWLKPADITARVLGGAGG